MAVHVRVEAGFQGSEQAVALLPGNLFRFWHRAWDQWRSEGSCAFGQRGHDRDGRNGGQKGSRRSGTEEIRNRFTNCYSRPPHGAALGPEEWAYPKEHEEDSQKPFYAFHVTSGTRLPETRGQRGA